MCFIANQAKKTNSWYMRNHQKRKAALWSGEGAKKV